MQRFSFLCVLLFVPEVVQSFDGDCSQLPPQVVVPSPPINTPSWLLDWSPTLQGWDQYQKFIVDRAVCGLNSSCVAVGEEVNCSACSDKWISALKTALPGISSVVLEPPYTAFKYGGGGGAGGSTPQEFAQAVQALRRNGLRVILYTSMIHKGEDREWANGSLAKNHPEWSQRHRDGSAATIETKPMLSPSTSALAYTVNYTIELLRQFPADGIYLDDNQLGGNGSDPADFNVAAIAKFRQYLGSTYGQAWSASCFGVANISQAMPPKPPTAISTVQERTYFGAWVDFRDITMAESNEAFRLAIRSFAGEEPLIVVAGNEIEWSDYTLAFRRQLYHTDATLTEDYATKQWSASKPILLRGLSPVTAESIAPRPEYIALFGIFNLTDANNMTLQPSPILVQMFGGAFMSRCKPWLSSYGLQSIGTPGQNNSHNGSYVWSDGVSVLTAMLYWGNTYAERFFGAQLKAAPPIVSVFSRRSMDLRPGVPEIPDWLYWSTRAAGVPNIMISDDNIAINPETIPSRTQVLLIQNASVLNEKTVAAVQEFATIKGGVVICTPDLATRDFLGAMLPNNTFNIPRQTGPWGKGTIIIDDANPWPLVPQALETIRNYSWQQLANGENSDWQYIVYQDEGAEGIERLILHSLYLGTYAGQPTTSNINSTINFIIPNIQGCVCGVADVELHSPMKMVATSVSWAIVNASFKMSISSPAIYFVLEMKCKIC
eukprot:m.63131 g.63131  ORF g.63131 m.63131 type:complete len:718 (+) comp11562_c0_seq1:113-2266(+)